MASNKNSKSHSRLFAYLLGTAFAVALWKMGVITNDGMPATEDRQAQQVHVIDPGQSLSSSLTKELEIYAYWIYQESDIDIRIEILGGTLGDTSLEELAVKRMDELRIGATNKHERGILILYEPNRKDVRIEIGYGLEGYLPDAFISYLLHDHLPVYLSTGNLDFGLPSLMKLIQRRIRDAVIGDDFDPRVTEQIVHRGLLSSGAGATASSQSNGANSFEMAASKQVRVRYVPQPTPEAVYRLYLEWLREGIFDGNIKMFTAETRSYLRSWPMSKTFFHQIFLDEYSKRFKVVVKDQYALLYFTDTPFVSPHFFKKGENGWEMDIVAEVQNTQEYTGYPFTWGWRFSKDAYSEAFSIDLVKIDVIYRVAGGDNRPLPTRLEWKIRRRGG